MKNIVLGWAPDALEKVGGKAAALARLHEGDFNVPAWLVIRPTAFDAALAPAQRAALDGAPDDAALDALFDGVALRPEDAAALGEALGEVNPDGLPLAVRSSALEEDGAEHSFAGQLASFLCVEPTAEAVMAKVKAVWRSGFSARVLAYRRQRGLPGLPGAPAVIVQRMVEAEVSGVAFSADPVSGRRGVIVVAASYGLGEGLVSGQTEADAYHLNHQGQITHRAIADKRTALRRDGAAGVVTSQPVDPQAAGQPALTDEQAREVAELARRAERFFARPQDVEWAYQGRTLYALQSRPITSLGALADPDGQLVIWDNSNIAESYGGVTTPLTFSFARRAYEEVYRQFCRILGVPQRRIRDHAAVFSQMLGLVRGRVYYNLLSWYRVLALLPGFQTNRAFMEQMMGVKEGVPDALLPRAQPLRPVARARDRLALLGAAAGLIGSHLTLGRRTRAFYARLDAALGKGNADFSGHRPDELVAHYRDLERQLLTRWDAPLVNDFFAMIFYGVLRKLAASWCGDAPGSLQNDLLCGEGGMISTEPAQRLQAMAKLAAPEGQLVEALRHAPVRRAARALEAHPQLGPLYHAYLNTFGDRCLDELKLESVNLGDDPAPLLRALGQLAHAHRTRGAPPTGNPERELRHQAEARARAALRNPIKRAVFRWVVRQARARVRDRENLRFERTRVFGRVRMVFSELGRRFYALGALDDPRDVFFLEVEEALGYVTGTATTTNLKGLVAARRAEYARYENEPAPADRFATRGVVHRGNAFEAEGVAMGVETQGQVRRGMGCCPGKVRGRVRVVIDPRETQLEAGAILVAERTDPSWILLFPFAAGVLVERGSLLSHAAIVSREMGIPSVVALPGLLEWLRDGDEVTFDGATGEVRRLNGGDDAQ